MNKLVPVIIMMRLRKAGVDKTLEDIGSATLSDLLNSVSLNNKYNVNELIEQCNEISGESFRPLDELGLSPIYNLADKYRFEIGTSLFAEENDSTATSLLNEYNKLNNELNAVKEKISQILAEDTYKVKIESIIDEANTIADIAIRYLKREGE